MKDMNPMKVIHLNLFIFITLLINKILITTESNCILNKFNLYEIQRMKCKTVSSGYNICVEPKGIYSFNLLLTKSFYYHDFSSITTIGNNFLLGLVAIKEIKVGDMKKNIILCFIKPSYLFVLSYKGEFIFFDQIDKKFQIDNYCSFILYNYINSTKNYNYIIFYTEGFKIKMYKYSLNLDEKSNEFISFLEYGGASNAGSSCELLLDNFQKNILVCFMIIFSEIYKLSSISFLIDENIEYLSSNDFIFDQDYLTGIKLIRISSYDKANVLICLIGETESKLAIYNNINNSLSQFNYSIEGCDYYYYSVNLYYFDESEEFVFSCIDTEHRYLKMIFIAKNYTIKENNKLEKYEFEGCTNADIFSILFIKPLNIYNTLVINTCNDHNYPVKNYLLIDDDSNCNNTIQNIQQLNETYIEEFDDDQHSQILQTSKITSQITEELTSKIPDINTESNEISESSQILISENSSEESIQIIKTSQSEEPQSIESNEIIENSQLDILNDFSKYSGIPENNETTEISELPKITQIIFPNEISDSYIINISEEITNKLTYVNDSIKINELTQEIFSNKITVNEKLTETIITTYNAKTDLVNKKETDKFNEITENIKTERFDDTPICEEKCSKCNEISSSKSLCIECNEKEQYFQILINSYMDKELLNEDYKECIKEETKPKNYYFNEIERAFKPCYYTCETCLSNGDSNDHNCITCAKNYIFNIYKNNNCIIGCKYYFYITDYKEYKCTIDNQCPEEASILIPELSKCTNSCKDEEKYNYQYNGQCLIRCPNDTEPNENYICKIKNVEKCTYKLLNLFLDNEIVKDNIEKLAKNYAKEFSYTNNHIINYISEEYSIILYKSSECITRLKINIPKIDFKECYQKVKDYYSLQKDLVIAIIDRYIYDKNTGVKNPDTTYAFFHPETGENLNASEICKNVKIIVEENILSIIEDNQTVLFFSNQNVDIFNISNEFYTDICFNFESPNSRDVVIKDRIHSYYPNVTLCDSGCKNTGINLTSLTAICECSFKDLLDNNFLNDNLLLDNIIINELIDQVTKTLKILNLKIMKCYKTIFNPKYMSKCTGFYIVLIIFLFEFGCIMTYFLFGKYEFIRFIYKVSQIYKDLYLIKNKNKFDLDLTQSFINSPPKKNKSILSKSTLLNAKKKSHNSKKLQETKKSKKKNQLNKSVSLNKLKNIKCKKTRKAIKNVNISINMAKVNINNIPPNNNSNSILIMNNNYMNKRKENRRFPKLNSAFKNKTKSKSEKFLISYKENEKVHGKYYEHSIEKEFNMQDYLLTSFDDMDFENAIL